MNRSPLCTLAAVLLAAGAVSAADLTLKNFDLGQTIYGPKLTADQLKSSTVLVEHWGIH